MFKNKQEFSLLRDLDGAERMGFLPQEVPSSIISNLNPKFSLRSYQSNAFRRFEFYLSNNNLLAHPAHLLFHMATGSGKTLIMAGCILFLYEKGYRNFIFFVNNTNIIEKTRDNFLNSTSEKFLFKENIKFGDKKVDIREVDNFQGGNIDDISIHFTTIQGLHSRLNSPRENSITYEDFEDKRIVLLSDEAHHLNVDTKRLAGRQMTLSEQEEAVSWESTVMHILNANLENLLLEFTATVDFTEIALVEKYKDKLLIDYPLRDYYLEKYSKDVRVLQIDTNRLDRALAALITSQYRYMVFANYDILIKPVVMFKSNYVNPPKRRDEESVVSSEFRDSFSQMLKALSIADLERIRDISGHEGALQDAFHYFEKHGITLENLILQLKEGFSDSKCISVDSSTDKEKTQLVINTLESPDNPYRAVFAVEALNEGWDVLNLFDIVRLYDTRDAKRGRPGKTTTREAQLIGRGARYCPFRILQDQPFDLRKYDDELGHPLRICEELIYHSKYNPRYIDELKTALVETGIPIRDNVQRQLKLKEKFKDTQFYRAGSIYVNQQLENKNETVVEIPEPIRKRIYIENIQTSTAQDSSLMVDDTRPVNFETIVERYSLSWFEERILRKATQKLEFYKFSNMRRFFPHLKSISEFITSENYLANIPVELRGHKHNFDDLLPERKLRICVSVLEKVGISIQQDNVERYGSKEFKPRSVKEVFTDKEMNFTLVEDGEAEIGYPMLHPKIAEHYLDLSQQDWYAFNENYGTSEEKKLVIYIKAVYERIKDQYDEIYLLRNESHFKLYDFIDGRPIEPDFVLFLNKKNEDTKTVFQVFIEPKGTHLLEKDKWKEDFLREISDEYEVEILINNQEVRIFGLPFYNHKHKLSEFSNKLNEIIFDQ